MEKEGDMTQLVTNLTKNKNQVDFHVDPTILQAHQNLIQWTCALACHLMASIPEFKHRKGPGVSLNCLRYNCLKKLYLVLAMYRTKFGEVFRSIVGTGKEIGLRSQFCTV